ncbi:hypothetical protein HW555_003878 [Spodoptera exigua]|uniref:Uncharacterized protein n=1 Tax=Spodoptera exigua TaxID=7107 RepID=A0A835GKK7_SPOEX|nr:hypothetical protein HW555_003878 [Spodoptera exigua]
MESKRFAPQYPECDHIVRKYEKLEINEELAKRLALEDSRIYPLFEKKLYDYERMKNSSLETNEFLKCRWKSFVRNIEKRVKEPFIFPSVRDFHFLNSFLQYTPNETVTNRSSYRYQMGEGPGVDTYGQVPISRDTTPSKPKHGNKIAKLPAAKK